MMFKQLTLATLIATLAIPHIAVAADEVNLYSARKEALIKPLLDKFTEQSGIKVKLITGKAAALQKRLELEGENSPADILVTTDAGNLHRASEAGLLQAIESEALKAAIPENLRDTDNEWFGLTYRARPIFYVKDKVKPEELSTYEALTDEQWKGRICIRSSNNIYNQSLTASMLAADGAEKTQEWANGLVKNMARPPKGGDRDQIKAAAAGQCDIAVANSYYYAGMLTGKDEGQKEAASKLAIFWPNQDDRGTHINISGIAVTKSAKNKDSAVKLMEFMVSEEAQKWYAEKNSEYPVVADIPSSELLTSWGDFKADSLNLSVLGENNAEAVKIMDKAGWK
uniref:Ferric iron ABC transporter, iron-binding protein n=1 Tax=uncultured Thiotrichaceae bacterium TaxID=298394 RepID=A0A6S6UHQ0_9GAMM|nr:MAG: Ferric iron ABC transporter, iron-binding protein [uncultured Thiotrichaceae bacterium]